MEMQGNATEIDERNLLQLDALLSHGYGLSPQLVMRSKGLSIEAKALYGYLSSFAGAGDTAFPSTSRILEELDISKNRFYKIRKELVSWGFISIETTATSAGLRTVYTLPQNPIAIKTEIDEIANRRNEIKSSLVANLHNEDMVSHKGDSESERLQQSAGNEPCRQSEAKAQNRGSNLKPCLQSEDEGCLQSGDKLYIDTNINPKVSIDEYELIKGHVRDFPEYVGQTQIPIKPGFKAIFDSDSSSTEKSEGEEAENACEFGKVASPYVHEGANKRPQKPTMKWLTKKLEKYNVGTGATRTSTLAEITANEERALMKENKGALTMTKCGEVSYALLANCQIASPEVTEKLFESMNEVGRFSRKPSDVINTVTDMVVHDMRAMQDNIGALDGMKLSDGHAIVIGKCPKCGRDLYATKNQFRCAGVHFKKTGEKDGKAVFSQDGTCDFSIYRFVGPKDKPKKLTDKNGREIAEKGKTSLIKGIKKKSGDGTYDAYLTLNRETWSLDMKFPEFKGKKHKG